MRASPLLLDNTQNDETCVTFLPNRCPSYIKCYILISKHLLEHLEMGGEISIEYILQYILYTSMINADHILKLIKNNFHL